MGNIRDLVELVVVSRYYRTFDDVTAYPAVGGIVDRGGCLEKGRSGCENFRQNFCFDFVGLWESPRRILHCSRVPLTTWNRMALLKTREEL